MCEHHYLLECSSVSTGAWPCTLPCRAAVHDGWQRCWAATWTQQTPWQPCPDQPDHLPYLTANQNPEDENRFLSSAGTQVWSSPVPPLSPPKGWQLTPLFQHIPAAAWCPAGDHLHWGTHKSVKLQWDGVRLSAFTGVCKTQTRVCSFGGCFWELSKLPRPLGITQLLMTPAGLSHYFSPIFVFE